jgi:hypothetical protein
MGQMIEAVLDWCANVAAKHRWVVLALTALLTLGAAYASTRLTINTSTDDILSPSLPFRQNEFAYARAFPREEIALVVVDGPSYNEATRATRALAERLRARQGLFTKVAVPGDEPFFETNGLLFLETDQLRGLATQIQQLQPVFSVLYSDPTLRGLAQLLERARSPEMIGAAGPQFETMLRELAQTTTALGSGKPAAMAWDKLFEGGVQLQGNRRFVLLTPVADNNSFQRFGPALDALQADIAAVRAAHPEARIRVTGDAALQQQELNDAFSGAVYASGLSFVLVALSLFLVRSWRLVAALLITLVIGSVWSTGLAALTVGRLNLISVGFMVLFFGIGVDFGTHLGLRYLEEVKSASSFREAITRAMAGEGPSILISALCAALAFLSFVPTAYTGLAEFGVISAISMVIAVAMTLVVLPALMAVMPPKPVTKTSAELAVGRWITRHYRGVLVAATAATVAAIVILPQARIDVNPLNLQNPNTEPVQTFHDLADDPQTSPYSLNVLARDAEEARALAQRLSAVPGVAGVRWLESFVPTDQDRKIEILGGLMRSLSSGSQGAPRVPPPNEAESKAAFEALRKAAGALGAAAAPGGTGEAARAFEAALADYATRRGTNPAAIKALDTALMSGFEPFTLGTARRLSVWKPVEPADIPKSLQASWVGRDGRLRLEVLPAGDITAPEDLRGFANRVKAVVPEAAGTPSVLVGAGDAVLRSFAQAIAYTFVAIVVVVGFLRRRLSDVVLIVAPLIIAAIWTIAGSALFNLPFNFANVIVIPLLIGLGVSSSVHIVARAREVSDNGIADESGAVMETSTPFAVLVAQLNTVAAFATLGLAEHRGLHSMGTLLGLSITFVLISSLLVLPALMTALERRRTRRRVVR